MTCSGELDILTKPFFEKTEITGHSTDYPLVSVANKEKSLTKYIGVFITLRHYDIEGKESML
jgi:hypothetical protein